jgi:eukaryotic-like serine/threonine-protein kinase
LEQIGRYHIEGELGKGAMGVVYRGTDPNIGRTVALKTMRLDVHGIEAEEMLQRFRNEARSAGVLNHPNIVTIYDAGESDGLFYMAMEVIEGETLQQLLSRNRVLPVEQVLSVCRQVGEGLDFAHARGVIHRDIKPANIMITSNGLVKIMDFGIAKAGGGLTSTGQVLGTPNYMSPEQVKGKPLDGRTDLFSLGVVLYEMLTGEKPFGAQNVTTIIYKIVHEDPISPRELDVSIHPGLSAVVARALSKTPELRYQSGAEMATDLENYKSYGTDLNSTQAMNATMVTATNEQVKAAAATQMMMAASAVAPVDAQNMNTSTMSAVPEAAAQVTSVMDGSGRTPAAAQVPLAQIPVTQAPAAPKVVAPTKTSSGNKGLIYGGVAVLLVALGAFGLRTMRHSTEPKPEAAETTAATPVTPTPTTPSTTQPAVPQPENAATTAEKPNGATTPATPATPVAKGELLITTTPPGATVKFDGKKLAGVTPVTQKEIAPGKHTVQLTAPGYLTVLKSVDVASGSPTSENVTLVPQQGVVKLSSVPTGAEIFVDGAATNKKTPSEFTLPKGDHTFMVRMQGYDEAGDLIAVNPGETSAFAPILSATRKGGDNPFKKMGKFFAGDEKSSMTVTTDPAGAFVFINGRRIPGQTPLTTAVPVGRFFMAIRKPGYAPVQKAVTIEKGKSTTITQPLTAKAE